jgi:hypothetical protein
LVYCKINCFCLYVKKMNIENVQVCGVFSQFMTFLPPVAIACYVTCFPDMIFFHVVSIVGSVTGS